jgi:hypothetical protein
MRTWPGWSQTALSQAGVKGLAELTIRIVEHNVSGEFVLLSEPPELRNSLGDPFRHGTWILCRRDHSGGLGWLYMIQYKRGLGGIIGLGRRLICRHVRNVFWRRHGLPDWQRGRLLVKPRIAIVGFKDQRRERGVIQSTARR